MHKQILILRGPEEITYPSFKDSIFETVENISHHPGIAVSRVTLTESPPPRLSIIPFKRRKIAVVSLYGSAHPSFESLAEIKGLGGIYRVTEALPVAYERTWPNLTPTPGACLLTLFRKKKGLDWDQFIHRWHNGHTPLSLKIHPLWHYSRNVVDMSEPETAEPWNGIVEEHVRERSELINPFRFFGPFPVVFRRMWQVWSDTRSFLDYRTIETYLVREYYLKS